MEGSGIQLPKSVLGYFRVHYRQHSSFETVLTFILVTASNDSFVLVACKYNK